jgi:hypothetical protein
MYPSIRIEKTKVDNGDKRDIPSNFSEVNIKVLPRAKKVDSIDESIQLTNRHIITRPF